MCTICKLYKDKKLTTSEALRATFELASTSTVDMDHLQLVYAELEQEETSLPST